MNFTKFDSVHEFCTQPFKLPENQSACARGLGGTGGYWANNSDSDWYGGTRSGNEAAARVTKGWPEGADRVMTNLESLEAPVPMKVQRRIVRGPAGDELDIHAVYRGDLEHAWTSRKRQNARGPFMVRIIAQTNLLSEFSGEQLFWRGAAAVKAIDMLSEAGYTVEAIGVLASDFVSGNDNDFVQTFPLKEAGSPLDVAQLAGVVCNAGFHRLFGFRAYFAAVDRHHNGPGNARSEATGKLIDSLNLGADGIPTFRIPYQISSKEQAEGWLRNLVTELEGDRETL